MILLGCIVKILMVKTYPSFHERLTHCYYSLPFYFHLSIAHLTPDLTKGYKRLLTKGYKRLYKWS
jgi:hypothetical protein